MKDKTLVLLVTIHKDLFESAVIAFNNNTHKLAYKAYQISMSIPN